MKHIMMDLETLGTAPGATILSVGCVEFDPTTSDVIGRQFYRRLDWASQGLIDPKTLKWWMQQNEAVRAEAFGGDVPLEVAANAFVDFWYQAAAEFLWCHGAGFDEPIWKYATANASPWHYGNVRDTRTIYHAAGISPVREPGSHHNALSDAIAQAEAVIRCYAKLGLRNA